MPTATLLLRESNGPSLSAIVERSQFKKPPLLEYDLRLRSCQLDLVLMNKDQLTIPNAKPTSSPDEGFESDIDSASIVSSDDSFSTPSNVPKTETDSANGSACSDTDDEPKEVPTPPEKETHDLVNCLCYSDVKFPNLLVFVIKSDALVFKFANLEELQKFHANFNTLKAVTNQKAYGKTLGGRFNLLQRTDNNGVTHIEISREPKVNGLDAGRSSNIISLNTPENFIHEKILQKLNEAPKKPERRKKPKGKAPPPPMTANPEENVLRGEYIRVNVPKIEVITEKLSQNSIGEPNNNNTSNQFNIYPKPKLTTYQQFKYITEPKNPDRMQNPARANWTSSIPRSSKFRSKSETRGFTPMAYRYVDTTESPLYSRKCRPPILIQPPAQISNRLFGMSGKLKDFSNGDAAKIGESNRWNSLGELSNRGQLDTNLKSVIKKEDAKKKEKKVTFSAYTTVQVV